MVWRSPLIGMIQISAAAGFEEIVRSLGGDPQDILARVGLQPESLSDPEGNIPLSSYAALLEEAARQTRRSEFGLCFAAAFDVKRLGPLGYLLHHGRTLGSALESYTRFHVAVQTNTDIALSASGGVACLRYGVRDTLAYDRVQDAEFSLVLAHHFCRRVAGPRWRCHGVDFEHPSHGTDAYYRHVFAAPVRFGQAINAFYFPVELLQIGNRDADPLLTAFLERHLGQTIQQNSARGSLLEAVEASIAAALKGAREVALETTAADLGISPRTLQRRLDIAGSSFSQLFNQARLKLAKAYLRGGDLSVTDIALHLGYSETSAFSRAFKAATGETPLAFRRQNLGLSRLGHGIGPNAASGV